MCKYPFKKAIVAAHHSAGSKAISAERKIIPTWKTFETAASLSSIKWTVYLVFLSPQLLPRRCTWLYVMNNVLMSVSGNISWSLSLLENIHSTLYIICCFNKVSFAQESRRSFTPTVWYLCSNREDICRRNTAACLSVPVASLRESSTGLDRPLNVSVFQTYPQWLSGTSEGFLLLSTCRKFAISMKIPDTKGCRRCSVGKWLHGFKWLTDAPPHVFHCFILWELQLCGQRCSVLILRLQVRAQVVPGQRADFFFF